MLAMPVNATHAEYDDAQPGWIRARDANLSRGKMRKKRRNSACGGVWVHGGA